MYENHNAAEIWVAGAFAALAVDLLIYPLDTIKTRLQSPDTRRLYMNSDGTRPSRAMFRGVYQGIGTAALSTLPSSGAFFTTYETLKSALKQRNKNGIVTDSVIHVIASVSAELVSCAILTPAEVIKQHAQIYEKSKSGEPRLNATIAALEKFKAQPSTLWRGYTALASRNLPFTALQFPLYEKIKQNIHWYKRHHTTRTSTVRDNLLITAVSAGIGGSIAALITTPVDVIKTRIMLSAANHAADGSERRGQNLSTTWRSRPPTASVKGRVVCAYRKNALGYAKEILSEEGMKGLFRGGILRSFWTMIGAGLYLSVYEGGCIYLARRKGNILSIEDIES